MRARLAIAAGAAVAAVVACGSSSGPSSATPPTGSPSGSATATASPTPAGPQSTPTVHTSTAPAPAGADALAIHVSGSHLVGADGKPVVLRGVNVSGTEFSCDQKGGPSGRGWSIYADQPLDQASTYTAMTAWNVHVVRVPLNEDCWLGINGVQPQYGGDAYVAAIQKEVSLVHAAGMRAILDLHWSSPGGYAAIAQQPMPDADHSVDFWSSVATTFRDDPAVIFDLFNEPYVYGSDTADPKQPQWGCWLNGCAMKQFVSAKQTGPDGSATQYKTSLRWQAAGMQQLLDAVRRAGARQPVMVNGLDWSNDLSGWAKYAPRDPLSQLVAGWHSYPGEACDQAKCWNGAIASLASSHPVIAGEVGDKVCGPAPFIDGMLSWADDHGVGYLGWTWNPWSNCDDVLIKSWKGDPTQNFGAAFRAILLAHQ